MEPEVRAMIRNHRELWAEAISTAYEKLSDEEKEEVDRLVQIIADNIRMRRFRSPGFGALSGLELVAALGVWLNEQPVPN